MCRALLWTLSCGLAVGTPAALAEPPEAAAQKVLAAAMVEAHTIPKQADALARLAWPEDGSGDALVQALARDKLVNFGELGLPALRSAIARVSDRFRGDATAALVSAYRKVGSGIPADYLAALEEAAWSDAIEAQRVAIPQAARHRYSGIVNVAIDVAEEHPELRRVVVQALGVSRNPHARFFLSDVLGNGTDRERALATSSLAMIGGEALDSLRDAASSENAAVRLLALDALLPFTGLDDLTVLHEYARLHPDDDPAVLDRIRQRAAYLESVLEALQQGDDSLGPTPDL